MAIRALPDPELLRKLVDYDPTTGELRWKRRWPALFKEGCRSSEWACAVWNTKNAGKPAFDQLRSDGYLSGTLLGTLHLSQRIAWSIFHGVREFGLIGHSDEDRTNNRIDNLFCADRVVFSQNTLQRRDCSSGVTGVNRFVNEWGTQYWVARIQVRKRRILLGYFHKLEDAVTARRNAEKEHKFGARHGKVRI